MILNKEGFNQTQIATAIVVNKSTISRELGRNTGKLELHSKTYLAKVSINRTQERHPLKRKKIRFTEQLKKQARAWLEEDKLSPEFISATWKKLKKIQIERQESLSN